MASTKKKSNAKTEVHVGLGLMVVLVLVWSRIVPVRTLDSWQLDDTYKLISGCVLAMYLLTQWLLVFQRARQKSSSYQYKIHVWVGLLGIPIVLAHTTHIGYGFLTALCMLFAISAGVGLLRRVRWVQKKAVATWTLIHIVSAMLASALAVVHICVVAYYE